MSLKSDKYKKEFFEKIVSSSINIKDVARNLGLTTSCGNRNTIKKYIKIHGLDTKHFYIPKRKDFSKTNKIDLKDILISGSTYLNTSNFKERLYSHGFKKRICELCGQGETWNGFKISLILDHKNGINNDNRIQNLRILCPNCNAGQETFCRGVRRKKTKKYKTTLELSLAQRKTERPSLEVLKKEIKELGYCGTGKKYGVSDNAIRKWEKIGLLVQ
jgi:5-methylcytosine-specific restriction endonuclease McrA